MKRHLRTILSFVLAAAVTMPTAAIPFGTQAEPSRDFDENFSGYQAPVDVKEQTSGRWTTYWSSQESDTKLIEDSGLEDGSGNVLKMGVAQKQEDPSGSGHHAVMGTFDSSVTEPGVSTFSFQVYVPGDIANPNGGTYNDPATNNVSINVVDTGGKDMISFDIAAADGQARIRPIFLYDDGSGEGSDDGANQTMAYFPLDTWITAEATVDTVDKTLTFAFYDEEGEVLLQSARKYRMRQSNLSGYTALAEKIRIAVWREEGNSLTYFDNFRYETIPAADVVETDKNAIDLGDLSNVTADIALPAAGEVYGSAITWSTQSDALLIEDGAAKPLYTDTEQQATLTATITKGGAAATRDFTVTIPAGETGDIALSDAYRALTFDAIKGGNAYPWAITGNLALDDFSAEDVGVTWAAELANAIDAATGTVTRGYDDVDALLTATLTAGGKTLSKSFDLRVLRQGSVLFADDFSSAYTDVADGTSMDGLNGWAEEASENATVTIETIDGNRVAQVQRVAPVATPNNVLKHSFDGTPQENKTVVFESDLYFDGGNTFFNLYIRAITEKYPSGTSAIEMAFDYSRNNIWVKTTQNPTVEISKNLPPRNKWFHLTIEVNFPTQTFDVWIDNQKINTSPLQFVFADDGSETPDRAKSISQVMYLVLRNGSESTYPFTAYVDNVMLRTAENTQMGILQRLLDGLQFVSFAGEKEYYVTKDFIPAVAGLPESATAAFISSNDAILRNQDGTMVVKRAKYDQNVDFTVKLTDTASGESVEKTFPLLVLGEGETVNGDNFSSYASGSNINGQGNWNVSDASNENCTHLVTASPDDTADQVLDIHRVAKNETNQYANFTGLGGPAGEVVVQSRLKFTGGATNRYNVNVFGTYLGSDGVTPISRSLAEISFDFAQNGICLPIAREGVEIPYSKEYDFGQEKPLNEWFNFRIAMNTEEQTYDLYINDVKLNSEKLTFRYKNNNAAKENDEATAELLTNLPVISVDQVSFGSYRHDSAEGHMYVDDVAVRVLGDDSVFVEMAKKNLTIFEKSVMFDLELPDEGANGASVTWESDTPAIITKDGKVTRQIGFGTNVVKMTATISRGEISDTKEFDVEVPQMPPYLIKSLTFADGGYQPKPGGTLNSILIEKKTTETHDTDQLVVSVSNGGKLESVQLYPLTDGEIQLNLALPADGNPVIQAYLWDMATLKPLSYALETGNDIKEGNPVTIYMCGDSTMENVNLAGKEGKTEEELKIMQTGWGEVLQKQFDESYVKVNNNYSKGGKSSKSFYDEGRLNSILEQIQPGDYLFIQFGHNDAKVQEPQNYTTLGEGGSYRQYLTRYVEGARSKGAIPVLVTSIYRRMFSGGIAQNSGAGYPEEMIALAEALDAPLLDLHARSGEWLTKLGEEGSAQYYMFSVNGTDNSHLTYTGANEIAKLANGEIARVGLPIAKYLKPLS